MSRVAIIGGGITGLSAAYFLHKRAPETKISLLEAGSRWGGKIATEHVTFGDGEFVIEGGPDAFLASKPQAAALCAELGLDGRLQGTNPVTKNTYVLHHGRLEPFPAGLTMMIPTSVPAMLKTPLLSWSAKVRLGLDLFMPARAPGGDESLGTFISRRLGRQAFENLIEPLMSGIHAGDGDRLSLAATFPALPDLEIKYGSLVRGARQVRKNLPPSASPRSAFLTPVGGLAEMVGALVCRLESLDLQLNTPVSQILTTDSGYTLALEDGRSLQANAVILATPAYVAAGLLAVSDPKLAGALGRIPFASTATVSLGYRTADLPQAIDGYGYVIPRRAGRKTLACTWTSSKFARRAPAGYTLLRVFIGRAGQEHEIEWSEAELARLAREELAATLGIRAEPVVSRVFFWDKGMPQYNLGHAKILEEIVAGLARHPTLALAGAGYRGVGIPDCIRSAELAVDKLQPLAPA